MRGATFALPLPPGASFFAFFDIPPPTVTAICDQLLEEYTAGRGSTLLQLLPAGARAGGAPLVRNAAGQLQLAPPQPPPEEPLPQPPSQQ
jgi:hypothetical protein